MTMQKRWLFVWPLCVASLAAGQDATMKNAPSPEAQEILKKAADAAKQVKTVRYAFKRQGIGADETKQPKLEGTAVYSGWAFNTVQRFRVDMKVMRPGAAEPTTVAAGSDGDVVYLVDQAKKTVFADLDPAVLGANNRLVRAAMITDFVEAEPFADELKADALVLKGTSSVGGDECFEVSAPPGPGRQMEVVWFIAKKDYLPRKMELLFPSQDGQPGGRRMELSDLVINPKLEADAFKMVVPEGFKKTDEFAP